jgi:hypothetical protein
MLRFYPLLKPFWEKIMDWDSSEIVFLEENVPLLPSSLLCNLAYNRPSIFVAHFSKVIIPGPTFLRPRAAFTAGEQSPDFYMTG